MMLHLLATAPGHLRNLFDLSRDQMARLVEASGSSIER